MDSEHTDTPAWEPTASIVISGVTAIAGATGLYMAGSFLAGPQHGGMEHPGGFVLMMAAMAATLVVTIVGIMTAGIGLARSKNRGVNAPALNVTFAVNLAEFVLVFALPAIMGRL